MFRQMWRSFEFANVLVAPHYVHGVTTAADWALAQTNPAPVRDTLNYRSSAYVDRDSVLLVPVYKSIELYMYL